MTSRHWRLVRHMAAWVVLSRTKAKMLVCISTGRLDRQGGTIGSAITGVVESLMIQGIKWSWVNVLVEECTKVLTSTKGQTSKAPS